MGWTSIETLGRPTTQQVDDQVEASLKSDHAAITDRSGWLGWNKHRYYLYELDPTYKPEEKARRLITVVMANISNTGFAWKIIDETMGPNNHDCPARLVRKANQYPPHNETARAWRAKVLAYNDHTSQAKALIAKIKEEFPSGDRRLIIWRYTGDRNPGTLKPITENIEVLYYPAKRRKSVTNAYSIPGDSTLYRLSPDYIDLEATQALRENP